MEVKVDDGAEANILPLHTWRDENGYPKIDALRDTKTTLQCYDDSKLKNHGTITLQLKHYWQDSFQDHQFFIVETPTRKEIIIGHPASVRLGLIQVLCENHAKTVSSIESNQTNNLVRVHNIDGKTQQPKRSSSEPKSDRRRRSSKPASSQIEYRQTKSSPKHQTEHPYSTHNRICSNSSSFQDQNPQREEVKWQNMLISRPLTQSMMNRVKELNPKYYLPTNEQTQIVSEPVRALRDWPKEDSAEAPLLASRFNPIYVEPGSVQINSTRDLQTLADPVSKLFRSNRWHVRRIWHQNRPQCTARSTRKTESAHRAQSRDRKGAERDGLPRYNSETDGTDTMGHFEALPQQAQHLAPQYSPKRNSFKTPENPTSTVYSIHHYKTLSHRLWHRTRTS